MSGAEKGWQPIEGGDENETHGFSRQQAMLRTNAEAVIDPGLVKVVESLPDEQKNEAHREIEISKKLTQEEQSRARALLEEQRAPVVLVAEMEQVWYSTEDICENIDTTTTLTSGAMYVCQNMQIRVRSLKTAQGTEYHWCIKLPGGDDSERLEFEGVEQTWDDALVRLNEKIMALLNARLYTEPQPIKFKPVTAETPTLMSVKKKRTSYRYDERPNGKQLPCTGSQVDFDEWYEINGHSNDDGTPLLITVDVEGRELNGNAAGLPPEQACLVPSVENCAWCLSLPENGGYNLFKMVGENWPKK